MEADKKDMEQSEKVENKPPELSKEKYFEVNKNF